MRALDEDLEEDEADEDGEPLNDDAQYDNDRDPANIDDLEEADDELLDVCDVTITTKRLYMRL